MIAIHRVLVLALLVSACLVAAADLRGGDKDKKEEKQAVDIRATVKKLKAVAPGSPAPLLGTLFLEGAKDKDTGYDKAYVKVTKDTKIFVSDGKERKAAAFKDLKEGQRVEARFTGPVAESFPVQATAGEIVILPAADDKK